MFKRDTTEVCRTNVCSSDKISWLDKIIQLQTTKAEEKNRTDFYLTNVRNYIEQMFVGRMNIQRKKQIAVVNNTTADGKNGASWIVVNSTPWAIAQGWTEKKLSKTSCIADGKLYYINRKAHGRKESAMSKSALQNIVNDMTSKQPAKRNNRWSEG